MCNMASCGEYVTFEQESMATHYLDIDGNICFLVKSFDGERIKLGFIRSYAINEHTSPNI